MALPRALLLLGLVLLPLAPAAAAPAVVGHGDGRNLLYGVVDLTADFVATSNGGITDVEFACTGIRFMIRATLDCTVHTGSTSFTLTDPSPLNTALVSSSRTTSVAPTQVSVCATFRDTPFLPVCTTRVV